MAKTKDTRGIGRKGGFKSLGQNLPRNAYKGKVEKIREGLIHNAKVKRAYYRTLKREEKAGTLPSSTLLAGGDDESAREEFRSLHPSRMEALTKSLANKSPDTAEKTTNSRRTLTKAEKSAMAEERRKEAQRNREERERKIRERERKRNALRKTTKKGQPVMKPRLENLLGKVKQLVGSSNGR